MISFLSNRALLLKKEFTTRHPHAWLVWEPGGWNPPAKAALSATLQPPKKATQPAVGDALCFELKPPAGKPSLSVGRDPANDLVLNDATVSREHLLLNHDAGKWSVLAVASNVKIGTVTPSFTTPVALVSGVGISLGSVQLTYYDPPGLLVRLAAEHVKAAK